MKDSSVESLVIGSDGLIGGALFAELLRQPAANPVLGSTRRTSATHQADHRFHIDLASPASQWELPDEVGCAYLCAGIASIQTCRNQPEPTGWINCEQMVELARRLNERGSRIIYLSSNQVFDGSIPRRLAEHLPCPLTEYGRQRAKTEQALVKLPNTHILRLTKVLPPEGGSLLTSWRNQLQAGKAIHPFSDMRFAPVSLGRVTEVLIRMADPDTPQVVQLSATEDITYEQAARHIAGKIGADPLLIQPVSMANEDIESAAAPFHTTLDTGELEALGFAAPSPWQTLDEVVGKPRRG
jgi:dTDP-4-dehydrorhamnose reductase